MDNLSFFSLPIEKQFEQAVLFVSNNSQLDVSNEQKLRFYGLYKQVTIGNCNVSKPYFWDMVGVSKWDAWNSFKDVKKEDCMKLYIQEVSKVEPNWSFSQILETKNSKSSNSSGGPVFSRPESDQDVFIPEDKKDITYYASIGDKDKVLDLLKKNKDLVNAQDEEGRSALHYACDRGNILLVKELINYGSSINLQDNEGQTGLHYSSMVGNKEIIQLLLQSGADSSILDEEGSSPLDVAEPEVKDLIKEFTN